MLWKTYFAVMLGGALGAGLRLWLTTVMTHWAGETFPLGTVVVNLSGCFAIGLISALTAPDRPAEASLLTQQFLIVGLLGGYTTFSAFSLQTLLLMQTGAWERAMLNIAASVLGCLAATWAGQALVNAVVNR
jgi:CrcB protein